MYIIEPVHVEYVYIEHVENVYIEHVENVYIEHQWRNGFRAPGDFCLGAPVVRVWWRRAPPNELHQRGSGAQPPLGSRGGAPCGG